MVGAVRAGVVVLVPVLAAGVGGRGSLGGDDHALAAAELGGQAGQGGDGVGVVEASNAASTRDGVDDIHQILAAAAVVVAGGHGTGAVLVVDPGDVIGADVIVAGRIGPVGALLDLVAEGPGDDTGSVLVSLDDGAGGVLSVGHAVGIAIQAGAGSLLEPGGEVVAVLVLVVHQTVEGLLDDQQAQLVADGNQVLITRVVGDADGVGAHVLHDGHLAVDGIIVGSGAQGTLVMVHADAVELDSLAVEVEAGGLPLGPAEAEGILAGVDDHAVHQDLRTGGVQVGIVQRPQGGIRDLDLQLGLNSGAGGNGDGGFASNAVDGGADGDLGRNTAVVDHVDLDIGGAVAVSDVGSGDGDAVQIHMDIIQRV